MRKIYPSSVTARNSHAIGHDLWGTLHRDEFYITRIFLYRRKLYNPMDIGHSLRITSFI